jgi:hypothetical protein
MISLSLYPAPEIKRRDPLNRYAAAVEGLMTGMILDPTA